MAFAEILDPLSRKELSGVSRRWQSWLARSAYVGLVAFVVFRSWQDLLGRGPVGVSDYADFARGLFHVSFWGQLALVIPASVAAATDLVGREIRSGTLGLLLITPVGGRAIARGKRSLRGSAVCALGTLAFILLVLPWMVETLAGLPPAARRLLEMPNPRPILEAFSAGPRRREPAFALYAGFHLVAIPLFLWSMVWAVRGKPASA